MKIQDKTKRYLTMTGGAIVGLALVAAISTQFVPAPEAEDKLPVSKEPSISKQLEINRPSPEKELIIRTETAPITQLEEALSPQTDQPKQKLQPDLVKPKAPSEAQKADPTKKPDGEKVSEPPKAQEHDKVIQPANPPKPANEPQGGETKGGKIYVPGFGWIDDIGESEGTYAPDMYENGNKIGEM